MKRSRLSEAQFTAIASGYLALMNATEVEKFVKENGAKLFKNWGVTATSISRNSINRVFTKLDVYVSDLVESGLLNDFPYSTKNIVDPVERETEINKVISQIYLLLTDQISKDHIQEIHDIWREQGQGFLFDSTIWQGTEIMWKKMSGLDHTALRRLFSRVAFVCYFYDTYKETTVNDAHNSMLAFMLNQLKENPLE